MCNPCSTYFFLVPERMIFCSVFSQALRIILSCIESHANHYKRYIVPLVSVSADFYIRVFVQVFTSAAEVKRSASKKSLVYHCIGCGSYFFQPGLFWLIYRLRISRKLSRRRTVKIRRGLEVVFSRDRV